MTPIKFSLIPKLAWLLAQVTALQTGIDNVLAWQERKAWLSLDEQKARAEKDVGEPPRRVFIWIGVEVVVDLFSRSLSVCQTILQPGEIALILAMTS